MKRSGVLLKYTPEDEQCTLFQKSRPHLFRANAKLGRYHDIIEYRDINLETISISDGFGFNRDIDMSPYIAIYRDNRDISRYRLNIVMYLLAETSCTP